MIPERLVALLACPVCSTRPAVRQDGDFLVCTECGRRYPIIDGIPEMLPDSAIVPTPEPEG